MVNVQDVGAELWRAKEKRKWQIALRRYVFKENKAFVYAPYFGIGVDAFRRWISLQFSDGLQWENFSSKWQFGHVLPMSYFDFTNEEDLRLCWNFVNVRVEPLDKLHDASCGFKGGDLLKARLYFRELYAQSESELVLRFLTKIESIEAAFLASRPASTGLGAFLLEEASCLRQIAGFDAAAFLKLNEGVLLEEILAEQQLMARFG